MDVRRRKVFWVRIPSLLVSFVILGFAGLGLILSVQGIAPAITVTGGKIGIFMRMLLEMMEFAHMGI